jgi:hypothetical protein
MNSDQEMPSFCPECGGPVFLNDKACSACGKKNAAYAFDETQSVSRARAQTQVDISTDVPVTNDGSTLIYVILGVILLIVFGGILAMRSGSHASSGDSNSSSSTDSGNSTSSYISDTDQQFLDGSGDSYFLPTGLSVLSSRNITAGSDSNFKSMTDSIYAGLIANSGSIGQITEQGVEASLMPGNALYQIANNLFINQGAMQAFEDELKQDAANDEAAGKTYESYRN